MVTFLDSLVELNCVEGRAAVSEKKFKKSCLVIPDVGGESGGDMPHYALSLVYPYRHTGGGLAGVRISFSFFFFSRRFMTIKVSVTGQ